MQSTDTHNETGVSRSEPVTTATQPNSSQLKDEFRALTSSCGVCELRWRAKIRLTGDDRVRWLNGMVTNNIRDLAVGQGVYSFLLNPQGHILGDLYAYNRGNAFLIETDQSQLEKILATFDHYIIMDDVEVAQVSEQFTNIGIFGPSSESVLATAGIALPELKSLQLVDLDWRQSKVLIVRGEQENSPSYEIWIAPNRAHEILDALIAAGATQVSERALELYRVALGIPRYGQDIRERDLPQETEQQRALNFNKGCYVGQEIVERIRSRGNVHRTFTGLHFPGPAAEIGAKIQYQGKDVGEITTSAVIPTSHGDRAVGLGYIRREIGVPGKEVQVGDFVATVAAPPFADLLRD